ncbi:retrovirus-related pol polyprotein from transposon TNT 1-94 [Tanacetum coccineum]
MTGNRSQLMNFISKVLGTVRFGNDQIARIMGYGDVIISRVYYIKGLGITWSRDTNLYTISLDDMLKSSLICLLSKASKTKSWLWHRRLSHLNFESALGKSKKTSHQPKAKDTNQAKLYLLHVDLCGPMRMASINGKSSGPRIQGMTPATSSTGLGLNHVSQLPCLPQKRDGWDRLFQPMFEEYFNPPTIIVSPVQEAAAPRAKVLTDSPVSTSIDQDAPLRNNVFLIKLKWIYKVKTDESGGVLKNKARLVAQGFKQEEGIDFEDHFTLVARIKAILDLTLTMLSAYVPGIRLSLPKKHLQEVKRIFRYLNGTINMGLWYSKDTDMSLTVYADADHVGCQDTRRSTSGSA